MAEPLPHPGYAGIRQRVPAPARIAHPEDVGLAPRARVLVRDRVRLFQVGAAVIAIAVADDAFVHPEPGTSSGDHLASGLIPIAIAVLAALAYPRLRAGVRACLALVFGALALDAGIVDGVRHVAINTMSGDDLTAILAAFAGVGLLVLGAVTLWDSRRLDRPRRRRYMRRVLELVLAAVFTVLVVVPVGMAILVTHVARAPVPGANLGAAYRTATFTTSDGLRLSGWYVPSRNGAAVIVSPGRSAQVQEHARMLIRHGYGVLVFDRRGEGQSEGDRNMYEWSGDKDLIAAVTFLRRQPDIRHGEIGGLGLSVGGEMLLQTAAETTGLKAVASEGAGRRSLREHVHIPGLGTVQRWLTPWVVQTGALMVMSNTAPPPDLAQLVSRISPRPILLIRALHGLDDESLNRVYYAHARQPAALWEVPRGGHTGALAALPQQYEARVVGFFDRALLGSR
ncbi:MAG: alpha/beta hydrolase [Gemmatimonadales bacterium]